MPRGTVRKIRVVLKTDSTSLKTSVTLRIVQHSLCQYATLTFHFLVEKSTRTGIGPSVVEADADFTHSTYNGAGRPSLPSETWRVRKWQLVR